ncbi:aldo/keto reductase [Actinomyces wuliandei]|uniref:aldo/keto reductase n=1 Tax=Actinomyces wuliandei TaxID=2057743 RepID=UPI000FDC4C79|nr:aldo/keto reductase [Actinomyces wuliandei]
MSHMIADLDVGPLGLGGNVFGWTADEATSHAVLDAFVGAGGRLIDTADGYSHWAPGHVGGESESVIGSWLESRGCRDDVVIATKVSTKPGREGLAPANIRRALEESLERLGTDVVDLYYAHFDDPDTPLEETISTFEDLRRSGLVRYIGLSNYTPRRIEQWMLTASRLGCAAPVALQPHYNLLHRSEVEGVGGRGEVAASYGMALLPYFPLAAGFLTGKYRRGQVTDGDRAAMVSGYLCEECFAVVDVLTDIGDRHGVEPAAVALAWLRGRPGVTASLPSARNLDQLRAILPALSLELDEEESRLLTQVSDAAQG